MHHMLTVYFGTKFIVFGINMLINLWHIKTCVCYLELVLNVYRRGVVVYFYYHIFDMPINLGYCYIDS